MKNVSHDNTSNTTLDFPWGRVSIGPGTVPIAPGSVQKTLIKEVIKRFRKISDEGIFDDSDIENEKSTSPTK